MWPSWTRPPPSSSASTSSSPSPGASWSSYTRRCVAGPSLYPPQHGVPEYVIPPGSCHPREVAGGRGKPGVPVRCPFCGEAVGSGCLNKHVTQLVDHQGSTQLFPGVYSQRAEPGQSCVLSHVLRRFSRFVGCHGPGFFLCSPPPDIGIPSLYD